MTFRCYHTCLFDLLIEAVSEAEAKREYEALCGLAGECVVVIAERVSATGQPALIVGREEVSQSSLNG